MPYTLEHRDGGKEALVTQSGSICTFRTYFDVYKQALISIYSGSSGFRSCLSSLVVDASKQAPICIYSASPELEASFPPLCPLNSSIPSSLVIWTILICKLLVDPVSIC